MPNRFVALIKGCVSATLLTLNTLVCFSALLPVALLKLLLPIKPVRAALDLILNGICAVWIGANNRWMALAGRTRWDVTGVDSLRSRGWYLVSSNHQSWVDILVLQKVFNLRIPLLKFFLKKELIYVPIMGFCWWALDFPFMRRKGGASLAKDMEATRKACERFKVIPTSVLSFLEGTRFTQAKHDQQRSPYTHLLKPKIGGIAMALATMGEKFDALVDVTIVYPKGVPDFWDLMCGRLREVVVRVDKLPIPAALRHGEDAADAAYRSTLQNWITQMWQDKDRRIGELMGQPLAPTAAAALPVAQRA
ncbi:MAG: acyltransferase [Burkholderiales bacterium]|nr:acyltransferase [Burkholderiales bacterium]